MVEIKRRHRLATHCFRKFSDIGALRASFETKSRKPRVSKAEVLGTMRYECVTWSLDADHQAARTQHHRFLLRNIGFHRRKDSYRVLSYEDTLTTTKCQSVETSIRRRSFLFTGFLVCTGDSHFFCPSVGCQSRWQMERRGARGGE